MIPSGGDLKRMRMRGKRVKAWCSGSFQACAGHFWSIWVLLLQICSFSISFGHNGWAAILWRRSLEGIDNSSVIFYLSSSIIIYPSFGFFFLLLFYLSFPFPLRLSLIVPFTFTLIDTFLRTLSGPIKYHSIKEDHLYLASILSACITCLEGEWIFIKFFENHQSWTSPQELTESCGS